MYEGAGEGARMAVVAGMTGPATSGTDSPAAGVISAATRRPRGSQPWPGKQTRWAQRGPRSSSPPSSFTTSSPLSTSSNAPPLSPSSAAASHRPHSSPPHLAVQAARSTLDIRSVPAGCALYESSGTTEVFAVGVGCSLLVMQVKKAARDVEKSSCGGKTNSFAMAVNTASMASTSAVDGLTSSTGTDAHAGTLPLPSVSEVEAEILHATDRSLLPVRAPRALRAHVSAAQPTRSWKKNIPTRLKQMRTTRLEIIEPRVSFASP
ncbi:hypothetical protein B0H14DRAFT_61828 [Mycena olivaceomarginata]|nr:hypothetical protein B0H14DRAFT_61828 [Mycena olivaceomarginata]